MPRCFANDWKNDEVIEAARFVPIDFAPPAPRRVTPTVVEPPCLPSLVRRWRDPYGFSYASCLDCGAWSTSDRDPGVVAAAVAKHVAPAGSPVGNGT